MFYIGYINYVIILLLVTGTLILRFDVKAYIMAGLNKERNVSRFLGWLNIWLAVAILMAHWLYERWFW